MTTKLMPDQDLTVTLPGTNLLANGGFEQWGGPISITAALGYFTAAGPDSWGWGQGLSGDTVVTASKETSLQYIGSSCIKVVITGTTAQAACFGQFIGGPGSAGGDGVVSFAKSVRGKTLSLSVAVKTTIANKVKLRLRDDIGLTESAYHTGSGNWEILTVTRTIDASASYVAVFLGELAAGDFAIGTYYMDAAMLVVSSLPVNFVPDLNEIDKVKAGAISNLQRNAANMLANGGFEQWSTATTFVNPPAQSTHADGWSVWQTGSPAPSITISRESGAGNFESGAYSLKFNVTAVGTPADGAYVWQNVPQSQLIVGPWITFSVRVKTTSNKYRCSIYRVGDGDFTYSNYHSGSGNFETLSVTVAISSATTALQLAIGVIVLSDVTATSIAYFDSAMLVFGNQTPTFAADHVEIDKVKVGAVSDLRRNTVNILVNGGFEQWQRGTSFSNPVASNSFTADKWRVRGSPMPTAWSITREASTIDSGLYSLNLTVTTTGGVSYIFLQQEIENYKAYGGKTVSLSMRIKTTLTNVNIGLDNGVIAGVYSTPHTGSGNWETLSVTMAVPSNVANLAILVGQLGVISTVVAGTIYIDSAMMTVSNTPIAFVPTHPADELTRCLRYYEKNTLDIQMGKPIGRYGGNNYVRHDFTFQVTKAAVPSMTISKVSADLIHLPTTGTGTSGDTANWNYSSTAAGTTNFRFLGSRADQTTYPALEIDMNWTAEVT